jgi:hypothetical protein
MTKMMDEIESYLQDVADGAAMQKTGPLAAIQNLN